MYIYIYVYIYRWISLLFLTSKITTFQNEAQIDVLLTGCAGLRIHKTQKNATVSPALGPSHCWNSAATWSGQLDRRKGPDEKSRLELCDVIDRWTKSHQSKFKGNWKKYLDLIHLIFFFEVWAQSHVPLQMVSGDDSWSKPEVTPLHHWKDVSSRDLWVIQVNEVSQLDKSFRFFFLWKEPWMLCNQLQGRTCG